MATINPVWMARWQRLPNGLRQILWFGGLWLASVSVLSVVAMLIRWSLGL